MRLAGSPRRAGRLALPGCEVEKREGRLVVGPRAGAARGTGEAGAVTGDSARRLPIPGRLEEPGAGWVLDVRAARPADERPPDGPASDAAVVDADIVGPDLLVRYRRPGDRLRPLGLGGRKSLQDLFVDRKVPRAERDRVPVVTDREGRIVWVAGHGISEEFRVTPGTTSVLLLNFRRSGGAG
jgi:tRNA(Ile)-lysidine synthase